VLVYWVNE